MNHTPETSIHGCLFNFSNCPPLTPVYSPGIRNRVVIFLRLQLDYISESSWTLAVIITFQGMKTQRNAGKTMILLLFLSHKLCNLVFIQKGTLELHNLDHKLPFDTSCGLVGQHLLPSKTDLSAVLLRTAHTITMGVFPVISHYNVYPLSRRKYRKRYPGAKIYGC